MKGKTKIVLTNVETGEQEVHEDTNLVTNALDKIINIAMGCNQAPGAQLLPIATKALGGIMLFDENLTESADNIHFPTAQAHLVGYANQNTNTSDTHRGSYNNAESGKTATGFVSTWDFGTSQANGTIKAIARTGDSAGANPLIYYAKRQSISTKYGAPENDLSWFPVRFDGEYLYMLKSSTTQSHTMRLARVKIPMTSQGVADSFDMDRALEVIAEWDTTLFTYTYTSSGRSYTVTVYGDDPMYYEDGRDGYLYCLAHAVASNVQTDYNYKLNYFTVKYSDGSYTRSETYKVSLDARLVGATRGDVVFPYHEYGHVCNGVYYAEVSGAKAICIIPLDNPASNRLIEIISSESNDTLHSLCRISPVEGGVYYCIYHYTESGTEYRNGVLYPDGTFLTLDITGENTKGNNYTGYLTCNCDNLNVFRLINGTSSESENAKRYVHVDWTCNYLGTINNLSTPITKTAAQTMKIIYTLTDVDEEPAEEQEES